MTVELGKHYMASNAEVHWRSRQHAPKAPSSSVVSCLKPFSIEHHVSHGCDAAGVTLQRYESAKSQPARQLGALPRGPKAPADAFPSECIEPIRGVAVYRGVH